MKKFLLNTVAFISIYLMVVTGIRYSTTPVYPWGNDYFNFKTAFLQKHVNHRSFNTYFLGSSRIYRHVIPSLFDSLGKKALAGHQIQSFNMGCPATFPPELFFLTENFITAQPHAKYLIVELNENAIFDENIFSVKGGYWINFREFYFSYKLKRQSKEPARLKNIAYLTEGYLQHLITLRHLAHRSTATEFSLGTNKDGFYPLEAELLLEKNQHLLDLRYQLLEDTLILQRRAKSAQQLLLLSQKAPSSSVALQRIQKIINYCETKKTRIWFVLTPRTLNSDVVECFNALPEKNKINLCDPIKYPRFYQLAYAFDSGHLNTRGAMLFTRALFKEFKKQLEKTKTDRTSN